MSIKYNVGNHPDNVERNRHLIQARVSCGANGHQMTVYFQPGAIEQLMAKFSTTSEEVLMIELKKAKFSLVIER